MIELSSAGMTAAMMEARRRELERQREEERRKHVKSSIDAIAREIRDYEHKMAKSGQSSWVGEEILEIMDVVRVAENVSLAEVDVTLNQISIAKSMISELSKTSEGRRTKAEFESLQNEINVEALRLQLQITAGEVKSQSAKEEFDKLIKRVQDIHDGRSIDDIDVIKEKANTIQAKDTKTTIDEQLRKEILISLRNSMRSLGFALSKPIMDNETGLVVLTGTLPGERTVRFEVDIEGQMIFDMNGFADRSCATHLDNVLELLEKEFSIETGPVQHNWKNPDRISKGSRDMPIGGPVRRMGGGA